jgi:chromosome segregation ATPase
MKNSDKLTTEIKSLNERIARVRGELETAEEVHANARAALVQGSSKQALDAVTAAHSLVAALKEAISTLENELEQKSAELSQAQAKEKRQAALDRIGEIHHERDALEADYNAARERANESLRGPLNEMRTALQRWHDLGVEYDQLSASIGSNAKAESRFKVSPLEPFGVQVDQAFHVLGRIEERLLHKARVQLEQRRARERAARAA